MDSIESADILYVKIQKIKKYLETGKDPEYEVSKYNILLKNSVKLSPVN